MKRSLSLTSFTLLAFTMLAAVSPGPAGAADVIKFGISTPLSGPAAPWGIPHKNATELIFDEINAQGGLDVGGKKYKLEIVAYDHKYVIAKGVATVNRLIAKDGGRTWLRLALSLSGRDEPATVPRGLLFAPSSSH